MDVVSCAAKGYIDDLRESLANDPVAAKAFVDDLGNSALREWLLPVLSTSWSKRRDE